MLRTSGTICIAFFALSLLQLSSADILKPPFVWTFDDTSIEYELVQCSQLPLHIEALNNGDGFGVPPYYMIAIVPKGIPTTSFIGTDPSNLSWVINYPNGTKLSPVVVDAVGNSSRTPNTIFSVTEGDTSCLSSPPENDLKLVANVSTLETLETCQPLGLNVQGGTEPYSVTIAPLNMSSTNFSLGADTDFTWVNQVAPQSTLIATVSDANGWGTGTGYFKTTGSSNTTCLGFISIPEDTTVGDQRSSQSPPSTSTRSVLSTQSTHSTQSALSTQPTQSAHRTQPAHPATLGAGRVVAVIGGVAVATFHCAAGLLCYQHRRRHPRTTELVSRPAFRSDARPAQSNESAAGTEEGARVRDLRLGTTTLGSGYTTNTALLTLNSSSRLAADLGIVIQHEDAGGITELPPPYHEFQGRTDGSSP